MGGGSNGSNCKIKKTRFTWWWTLAKRGMNRDAIRKELVMLWQATDLKEWFAQARLGRYRK